MKRNNVKKFNSLMFAGVLSLAVCGTAIAATATFGTNDGSVAMAYESNYTIASSALGTGTTYYVSPEGTGTDYSNENPGDISTLLGGNTLVGGDTVIVKPGTYKLLYRIRIDESGSSSAYITVKNEDPTQAAVLDFSAMYFNGNNRGVQIDGDYWYWYGVDICGAGDNGMYIGGSYNVIENCEFYNNRDSGLQLGRSDSGYATISQWPSYNLIKNCTSYNNFDNETYGENADGFAAKLTIGYGNIFDGCIAYRNSDDGWDLYAKADTGNIGAVIMYNCVAFENGYLGETQQTINDRFVYTYTGSDGQLVTVKTYDSSFNDDTRRDGYTTRDGDGNGFKLGGSVMEGDVFMYNCMSFNNRMHGVTDNSNPGVLTIENVISYNNSATIDNTTGLIDYSAASDLSEGCNNIDLARQTYSYNIMSGILSVQDGNTSLGADRYRGSSQKSIYLASDYTSVTIDDYADASSIGESYAVKGTAGDKISASEVFEAVPTADVLSGVTSGGINNTIHDSLRNSDGSINMGSILKIKDYTKLFEGADKDTVGAYLCGNSWNDYTHYDYINASHTENAVTAAVKSAEATIRPNTNLNATYQDFDLTTVMKDVKITWTSSDESIIQIDTNTETAVSGVHDARAIVYRGSTDKQVKLTVTIVGLNNSAVSATREFTVTVKADSPTIGTAVFEGVEDGMCIEDRYDPVSEAEFSVTNAADYNGKLLDESTYSVETIYEYAATKNDNKVEIKEFTTAVPGIYTITKNVKMNGSDVVKTFSYDVYVAGKSTTVDFVAGTVKVGVNRYGYTIEGDLSSPSGTLYVLMSETELSTENATAAYIMKNGVAKTFRATSIKYQYTQANTAGYHVYYVMANLNGIATTQVVHTEMQVVEVGTVAQFKEMLLAEDNSATIYTLIADIDLSGETSWVSSITSQAVKFKGVLNGMGHTVSGLTIDMGTSSDKERGCLFHGIDGGTIENIKFENITITASNSQKVGIIGVSNGGYIYNVSMKNVVVSGAQRVGGLIGQVGQGETYIEQVSLINERRYAVASDVTEDSFATNTYYTKGNDVYTKATGYTAGTTYYTIEADFAGDRAGAIVGFIQASSASDYTETYITDCYVDAVFGTGKDTYAGSIVGRYDDRNAKDDLKIENCYSVSIMRAAKYQGGIIGGQTGAGKLRVNNCIFTGELYYAGDLANKLTNTLKNCSCIMGYYSANADTVFSNCYGTLTEYYTNYQEDVDTLQIALKSIAKSTFWQNTSKYDMTEKWQLIGEGDSLTAPYVSLRFLGTWE